MSLVQILMLVFFVALEVNEAISIKRLRSSDHPSAGKLIRWTQGAMVVWLAFPILALEGLMPTSIQAGLLVVVVILAITIGILGDRS